MSSVVPLSAPEHSLSNLPDPKSRLSVVDDESALEQCQEWSFFAELIEDLCTGRVESIQPILTAIADNDHLQLKRWSHALVGTALILQLPALKDVTFGLRAVAIQLLLTPDSIPHLQQRHAFMHQLVVEYGRLEAVLPTYQRKGRIQDETVAADEATAEGNRVEEEFQAVEDPTQHVA